MHHAEQFDFDFDEAERLRPLTEHWFKLEALAREEFCEENLCLAWVTESDGRAWKDWWQSQPNYRRESMLNQYRAERAFADLIGRPMRLFAALQVTEESLAQDRAIIERFKTEIRQAAIERRPMPLLESESMSPGERLDFRRRLAQAFNETGVVIIAAPDAPPKHARAL